MKVFVTCGKHPLKSSGGYATYTHALCKSLKNLGYDVSIIAISDKVGVEESEIGRIYSVTSRFLSTKSSTFISSMAFLWSKIISKQLQKMISEEEGNCIIYGIGIWGYAGIECKRQFKDKVMLVNVFFTSSSHETYWLMKGAIIRDYGIFLRMKYSLIYLYARIVLKRFEKLSLKSSDKVIVHYDFARQVLIREFNIEPKKIANIPYYIEIYGKSSLYAKYDIMTKNLKDKNSEKHKSFTCVSICRQETRKGINYFLHAVRILKEKNIPIRAIIVGSGDVLNKNINLAKKLKIMDVVEFTGFVPNISDVLSKADVFVQPSLQEGSGSISVFEAMQSGIPVITTFCDGLEEDIENGENGILVEKMNVSDLSKAILDIYHDRNLAQKLAGNAKKSMQERFNMDNMINGLKKIHEKF